MREYEVVTETRKQISAVTCDRCKVVLDDIWSLQECHCFSGRGGYGSYMGDSDLWEVDICDKCWHEMVKDFVRYPEDELSTEEDD